jgi:hypothetical protein
MNVCHLDLLGPFTVDAAKGPFTLNGDITVVVPTAHEGNTESFGSGTLALQYTTDNGTSYQTYTDTSGNAATLTATNVTMRCFFAGPTKCRLSLGSSTSPDITCVNIKGHCYIPNPV